jgi:hypothetical protein
LNQPTDGVGHEKKGTMSTKNYVVGAEIEAYCTKCQIDRLHAIETLKSDGNVNRVVCRTCSGIHLFRRPKSESAKKKAKSASGTTKRRKKGATTITPEELGRAAPYTLDGVFKVGDIIQHAKFGPGRVLEVRRGGRVEIGFEDGSKTLVCRGA